MDGAHFGQASSHKKSSGDSHSIPRKRNLHSIAWNNPNRSQIHSHCTSPRQACHTACQPLSLDTYSCHLSIGSEVSSQMHEILRQLVFLQSLLYRSSLIIFGKLQK